MGTNVSVNIPIIKLFRSQRRRLCASGVRACALQAEAQKAHGLKFERHGFPPIKNQRIRLHRMSRPDASLLILRYPSV
jgi:hypothetical protein